MAETDKHVHTWRVTSAGGLVGTCGPFVVEHCACGLVQDRAAPRADVQRLIDGWDTRTMQFVLNFRDPTVAQLAVDLLRNHRQIMAAIRPYPEPGGPYTCQVWADLTQGDDRLQVQGYCRGIIDAVTYLGATPSWWMQT